MSASLTAQLTALAQRFRLGLSLEAIQTLPALLEQAASESLSWPAQQQQVLQRLAAQQEDEVQLLARLLASKVEQNQRVLVAVASGLTPALLRQPAALQAQVRQALASARWWDSLLLARADGVLLLHLRHGRTQEATTLEPAERDGLRRTLAEGKPLLSEPIIGPGTEARLLLTVPLHGEDGSPTLGLLEPTVGELGGDLVTLAGGDQRLGQQRHDFIGRIAGIQRAAQFLFGTGVVALLVVDLAQQETGFAEVGIFLERVLELDRRSGAVVLGDVVLGGGDHRFRLFATSRKKQGAKGAEGNVSHVTALRFGSHLHHSLIHVEVSFLSPKRFIRS